MIILTVLCRKSDGHKNHSNSPKNSYIKKIFQHTSNLISQLAISTAAVLELNSRLSTGTRALRGELALNLIKSDSKQKQGD